MENNNSVCYVARINEIKPIEGADNIEQAVVGGWNCIIQKGQYAEGGLVVVATTDAVIPLELSNTIGVTNYLRKGQRVRTVKLRGVYSECLIIPLLHLPKGDISKWTEGKDVMEALSIFKYEPSVKQIQLTSGKKIRYQSNVNFNIYYKFPNVKNVPKMFTEEDEVQITRKIHGTNARYGIVKKNKMSFWDKCKKTTYRFIKHTPESWNWADYEFVVGSHNVEKGSDSQGYYDVNVWYDIAKKYDIKNKLWLFMKNYTPTEIGSGIIIYGEIYGPCVQKNYYYGLKELEFTGFDISFDSEYQCTEITSFIIKNNLKLPHVPVLYTGHWSQEVQDKYVFNNMIENTKIPHEGIVVKHISGNRQKIAKVINPDYLIYGEKHDVGDNH